ncbi:hypothetical protein [Dongia sp.]|uniref:hypothetical protein n=1 Tax=Dongia sp. TaxID=1977262 RepID=UPI0035AF40FD
MTSQRPRRPIPASSLALQQPSQPPAGMPTQEYANKANLARHLHDQGINPLLWTKAHPAPFADQEEFRKTGRKVRESQFEVGGRLYDATPDIAATPAQGRAAFGTYLKKIGDPDAKDAPPLESFVEIEKVPLQHPLGQAASRVDTPENAAILLEMIKTRIDPKNAHLGDPLPMPVQDRLKQMFERKLMVETGSEPETSDLLYRNADGWIYAKNDATREAEDVLKIRAKHAEKRAQQAGTAPDAAANDNDPAEEEEILQHYMTRDGASHEPTQAAPVAAGEGESESSGDDELTFNKRAAERIAALAEDMPHIVAAVEKTQAGQELTGEEREILAGLEKAYEAVGLDLDLTKANPAYLRDVATAIENAHKAINGAGSSPISAETRRGRAPLHVAAQALNNELAQALVGSTIAWAQVSQHGATEALQRGLLGMRGLGGHIRRLGPLASAAMGGLNAAEIARRWAEEDGNPNIMSPYPGETESQPMDSAPSRTEPAPLEFQQSPITNTGQGQQVRDLAPPSPETLGVLESRAAEVTDFEILIGGVPLFKQGEHKTLMDNIFREEFIEIAQEKGCLPDPREPGKNFDQYGGDKPQKRIGDPDRTGNLGSRQPDGTVRWQNGDRSWTEVHWNSTTSGPDGFTEILREWRALVDMNKNIGNQLTKVFDGISTLNKYRTPILGDGPIYHMAEKRYLTPTQMRKYIRKKLRDRFDKDFKDCKFIGESRLVKLDEKNDPDLPTPEQE